MSEKKYVSFIPNHQMKLIRDNLRNEFRFISEKISTPKNAIKLQELSRAEIINLIDEFCNNLLSDINSGNVPSIDIPLRRRENILYDNRGNLFLGPKTETIEFGGEYHELTKILRVAEIVKALLTNDDYATKREIFYCDTNFFGDQRKSDRIIEELVTYFKVPRKDLHIIASPRGACVGCLKIRDGRDIIDLEMQGSGYWQIPTMLDEIEITESDAEFVLVLEKDATMMRLTRAKFWRDIPCILLTAHGSPNYATRSFLKMLVKELKIPVFGLADSDPYGVNIMMTYAYGSVQSALETPLMAINSFKWLGVFASDIKNYQLPKQDLIPMNKSDLQRGTYMLEEENVKNNKELKEELELMLHSKVKAEIQVLSSRGLDFLTRKYIPEKLETGDIIKF